MSLRHPSHNIMSKDSSSISPLYSSVAALQSNNIQRNILKVQKLQPWGIPYIATPPQFYRAEKTPADADHEFSKKNQKNRRKNSDDYNNNHDDDDDERTRISMSTERKKKRKRVYSSNNNNNNNNIKPRTGIKLIPRPKLEEFVDNNMGSEKSALIQ